MVQGKCLTDPALHVHTKESPHPISQSGNPWLARKPLLKKVYVRNCTAKVFQALSAHGNGTSAQTPYPPNKASSWRASTKGRRSSLYCQASTCDDLWQSLPANLQVSDAAQKFDTLHVDSQAAGSNEAAEIAAAQTQVTPQQQQQTAEACSQPKQYLYESKFGLPVVHKRLSYGDLLREIRTGNVKQIKFFATQEDMIELEGPCLIIFQDDTLAQGYVPHYDHRIPYAMENHGVVAVRLPAEPVPGTFTVQRMWNQNQQKVINRVIPLIAIGLVYFATQLAAKWKVRQPDLNTSI